ncbi:MAG TPA: hypothetical protein VN598_07490 [Usitatibacter sp.]|nr:hypothetical protein [Usitatibacter sp.]
MSSILRGTRAISFTLLAGISALPLLSQAANACEQAKQSAWFEQQRQLTDGNTSPFTGALASQCAGHETVAANDPRKGKDEKAKEKSTSRE